MKKLLILSDRSIPEYWIIDPSRQVVFVLVLNGQDYEQSAFRDLEMVRSGLEFVLYGAE